MQELEAQNFLVEIEVRRRAQQPKGVKARLSTFPVEGVPGAFQVVVRDALRREDVQAGADKGLADALGRAADALPTGVRKAWGRRLVEVLTGLSEAPDAVRDRLDAFRQAEADPKATYEAKFALAMSGWIVGSEAATHTRRSPRPRVGPRDGPRRVSRRSPRGRRRRRCLLGASQVPDRAAVEPARPGRGGGEEARLRARGQARPQRPAAAGGRVGQAGNEEAPARPRRQPEPTTSRPSTRSSCRPSTTPCGPIRPSSPCIAARPRRPPSAPGRPSTGGRRRRPGAATS